MITPWRYMSHPPEHRLAGRSDDLHGNAPDDSRVDLRFPDNKELVRRSVALAKSITKLKKRCKKLGIPAIYVNDNRGRWRSDICAVLRHCLRPQSPGREMTEMLIPEPDDYIVLKPVLCIAVANDTGLHWRPRGDRSRRYNERLRPDCRWRSACPGFQIVRAGGLCGCPESSRTPTFARHH
jgi:hypothetical protein